MATFSMIDAQSQSLAAVVGENKSLPDALTRLAPDNDNIPPVIFSFPI